MQKRKRGHPPLTPQMDVHPFLPAEIEAALSQRYLVGPEIAVGGQGTVFRATRTSRSDGTPANDVVALKLYLYRSQDVRVQREIATMENLAHPNLARMVEHGECDVAAKHTRYIAWELIEGQSLDHRLKGGRLLESEVLRVGGDIAAAIAAIWSRQIVHGDIKPSNIMLRDSGGAVLIDLGAAKYLREHALKPFRSFDHSWPAPASTWGTVGYFSPEQARGERVLSCAADIFSLGVVMLQSLLGRHPTDYDQNALAEGIRASERKLAASDPLLSALDRMLSTRPNFRPTPAGLSDYFQKLHHKLIAESGANPQSFENAQS